MNRPAQHHHPRSTSRSPWLAAFLVVSACAEPDPEEMTGDTTVGSNGASEAGDTSDSRSTEDGESSDGGGPGSGADTSTSGADPTGSTGSGPAGDESSGSTGEPGTGSPGCGLAPPGGDHFTIDVDGTTREYYLDVPEGYDPEHPHMLVFAWHWLDGSALDVVNGSWASFGPYYGLEEQADGAAIFVAPEGIDNGWSNPDGRDIDFALAMVSQLENELCIDEARIVSTGFSFGGMMSNAVGCSLADTFRAIAPMSGSLWSGCEAGGGPIAVWSAHGTNDGVVNINAGRQARDEFLGRNGCTNESTPTGEGPCVSYEGCSEGHPVVWCEWNGDHIPPDFSPVGLWGFFASL